MKNARIEAAKRSLRRWAEACELAQDISAGRSSLAPQHALWVLEYADDLERNLDRARADLDDALSGEADAVRRAESAELGCEIAYKREPTQAEGDAHEYRHDQSMGASKESGECHVPMGNHHGHRCRCGRWVWGGPTVCQQCVDAEAVKAALLRADVDAKAKAAWEGLYNERNRLWREEADRVGAVKTLLEKNGCDCECDCHLDSDIHDDDCVQCLACRIAAMVAP